VADFHGRDGSPCEIHFLQILGGSHSPPGDVFDGLIVGLANVPAVWILGDASLDGLVNDDDLSLVPANWSGRPAGAVPEPAMAAVLGLIAPALSRVRRKI